MPKVSALTDLAANDLADGDDLMVVDASAGTAGSKKFGIDSLRNALARLGFNPTTTGIMAINGTTQVNWDDGAFFPETDDDVDLGKTAKRFKDAYIDGIAYIDKIEGPTTLPFSVGGTTQWNSEDGAISPETTNDVDLGKTSKLFKNGYLVNLDLGASGVAGTLDVFPSTGSKGKLNLAVTDQTGDTTVSVVIGAMADARTITLRDPGAAASILTTTDATAAATTATAVELNYLDITTLGTGAASKAVVLDSGEDYTWPATGVLTYGVLNDGTTALAATALELNRTCDVSSRIVLAGATLAVTVALHDGKIIGFDQLAGSVCTLPAATGSGARFEFITKVLATSNSHVIKVADASGLLAGVITTGDNADGTATSFATVADSDTITLNRSTTGSVRIGGDRIVLTDIATNVYSVHGCAIGTGGEATPFSATV